MATSKNTLAVATFNDSYAGEILVTLVRKGALFVWRTATGSTVGIRAGSSAAHQIAAARGHRLFANVAVA